MATASPTPHSNVRNASLADVYEDASRCNKCSLCQAVCPTYIVNPVEWESARGRVALVRDAIEGNISLSDIADGPLSTCLGCNNCMAACAPGVPTADIVFRARQELSEEQGLSWGRRLALRAVLPSPTAMRALHRFSRITQVLGLHALARKTGFTQWLGTPGALADHVGPLPAKTAYARVRDLPAASEPVRMRLGFLVCCYQNIAAPQATEATMRVLLANGFEVATPTLGCSGLPARSLGDRESEIEMAHANVERLANVKVDAYIGDVASCTSQVQHYGHLLEHDAGAMRISEKTWLASHFLAEHGMRTELGPLPWRVAIDEPCSLPALDTEQRSAAARLLGSVPRLQLVDLNEAAMCCGGPGLYFDQQPEHSDAILMRKFENVIASGCEVLVTENISCLMQLRNGAERFAPHVRVMHLFEVLDAALTAAQRRVPLSVY